MQRKSRWTSTPEPIVEAASTKPTPSSSEPSRFWRQLPYAALFLVLITFIVAAGSHELFRLYFYFVSKSWVATDARVVEITQHDRSAEMVYEYRFDGNVFSDNTLSFVSEGTIPDKLFILERFRVGQRITVFVNPSNPSQAVAIRCELTSGVLFRIVCEIVLGFLILGWFLWMAVRYFRRGMREATTAA